MEILKIKIQSLEDAQCGEPLVAGVTPENTELSKDVTACILEAGMQSGRTSLMFVIKTKEGKYVAHELTPNHLNGLVAAFAGAVERFGK